MTFWDNQARFGTLPAWNIEVQKLVYCDRNQLVGGPGGYLYVVPLDRWEHIMMIDVKMGKVLYDVLTKTVNEFDPTCSTFKTILVSRMLDAIRRSLACRTPRVSIGRMVCK